MNAAGVCTGWVWGTAAVCLGWPVCCACVRVRARVNTCLRVCRWMRPRLCAWSAPAPLPLRENVFIRMHSWICMRAVCMGVRVRVCVCARLRACFQGRAAAVKSLSS